MGIFSNGINENLYKRNSTEIKELYTKFYSRLVYFSFQIIGDKEHAEDIAQDAFIKYWNLSELTFENEFAIKKFLYGMVRNSSLNVLRHNKIAQKYLHDFVEPVEEETIIHALIRSELIAQIYAALNKLPESCKKISIMGHLEGLRNYEIAQQLGISVNTVKTQKQRALKHLRINLQPDLFSS